MRTALFLALTATPALAHDGAHLHPHGGEGWLAMIGVLAIACAGLLALRGRR